jgi:DNA-directed RNA polymerase specialized sigma24 family protein
MLSRDQIAEIYARYRGPVWRYVRRPTGSTDLAEDLCQEAFLRLVTGSSRYEDRSWERRSIATERKGRERHET